MPMHPAMLQVNTRMWLSELGDALHRPATLDDLPASSIERIARSGFDWAWFLGVWQTSDAGRLISRHQPEWQAEYRELLGEVSDADVSGSPFAVQSYVVNRDFGGARASVCASVLRSEACG
jgi:hypothetical protein